MSDRRQRILDAITESVKVRGYPPTVREIGEAVGLSLSSSVHAQLDTLELMGLIRREPDKPRTIVVLRRSVVS